MQSEKTTYIPFSHPVAERYSRLFPVALIIITLTLTAFAYWPGLTGLFTLDDAYNLRSLNKSGGVTDLPSLLMFISERVGSLGRPISMLSFLIDDQYYPGEPGKYKYTNLMLHLLCGLFLLAFLLRILDATEVADNQKKFIAIGVFAFWLAHPFNVSTTLYIVQRMTQVMTLFVLVGLTSYAYGRSLLCSRPKTGLALISAALIPFGILATLSKENGVLICSYILVLELTILKGLPKPKWFKYWLLGFPALALFILFSYITYKFGNYLQVYELRDFTLTERVLTQFNILVTYIHHIIIPSPANTGIIHDDYPISRSLVSPITTLLSALLVCAVIISAFIFRKKQPVFSFAVLWFFSGHLLESTVLPLELYFEHRNYLPMAGPLLAVVYYAFTLPSRLQSQTASRIIRALPVLLIISSFFFTHQSAKTWGNPELLYHIWHQEHPNSLRAATTQVSLIANKGNYRLAIEKLEETYLNHPNTISLLLYIMELSCLSNSPSKYNVQDILNSAPNAVSRNALPAIAKKLVETAIKTNCRFVSTDELISIISALENIKWLRGTAKVEIIFLLSDLYVYKRNLSPAVETLDRAFKVQQLPVIPMRQAELLASAGLYKDALAYIGIAKKAAMTGYFLQPSQLPVINKMEENILSLANRHP